MGFFKKGVILVGIQRVFLKRPPSCSASAPSTSAAGSNYLDFKVNQPVYMHLLNWTFLRK